MVGEFSRFMVVIGANAGFTPSNSTRLTLNLRLSGLLITNDSIYVFVLAISLKLDLMFFMLLNSSAKRSIV